jgi:hypothetical protein
MPHIENQCHYCNYSLNSVPIGSLPLNSHYVPVLINTSSHPNPHIDEAIGHVLINNRSFSTAGATRDILAFPISSIYRDNLIEAFGVAETVRIFDIIEETMTSIRSIRESIDPPAITVEEHPDRDTGIHSSGDGLVYGGMATSNATDTIYSNWQNEFLSATEAWATMPIQSSAGGRTIRKPKPKLPGSAYQDRIKNLREKDFK